MVPIHTLRSSVMSIEVPIDQLFAELSQWGAGFLATVGDDGRPRLIALRPVAAETADGPVLEFAGAGRSACHNVAERPNVSVVFPPHEHSNGFSLIVDGVGSPAADQDSVVHVRPSWAVLHRRAP